MIRVEPFAASRAEAWDTFCAGAVNAGFLHTRKFLSYHGDRFRDASATLWSDDTLVGVLPAAWAPDSEDTVVSHPGATYGGIVHDGWLTGDRMLEAFAAVRAHYAGFGAVKLVYKPLPHIYARRPADDDLYALFRSGATLVRRDLSCTIDLADRGPVASRRRRALRKANQSVMIAETAGDIDAFWTVLEENLAAKHAARPVHSIDEIKSLMERFPAHILLRTASVDGELVAGTVLFVVNGVWHAQYIASSGKGQAHSALDAVFDAAIGAARAAGARYFDFGISTEQAGRKLNDGLYRFKSEFGGGGAVHDFFELGLA